MSLDVSALARCSTMMRMLWVRRFFVQIFSVLFILTLLLLALTFSVAASFSKPEKLQSWLSQSHIYDHFIDNIASQSDKSVTKGKDDSGNGLSDPAVKAAAQKAFTPELIEENVNIFINSNYDWLKGETASPNFKIDLTDAKKTFAQQVGLYIQSKLLSLPACSPEQQQQISQDTDPLKLACLPPNINPTTEGRAAEEKLANSQEFLGNPVITAATINPESAQAKPYYVKLAKAPKAYQNAQKIPVILAALAFISAVLIFFVSPIRRKGLRRIGFVLFIVGLLLVASKFVADFVLDKVEAKIFNNSNVGELQQSLSNFFGLAENAVLSITLWFGIAYAIVGLIILIIIFANRSRKTKARRTPPLNLDTAPTATDELSETPALSQRVTDVAPAPRPTVAGPPPIRPAGQKKKPKLVQF